MYIQYLKKIIFEIFISFSEKLKNEKKYFSPIYFAATWCQEKKKLKYSTIKKYFYHLKFFLAFSKK